MKKKIKLAFVFALVMTTLCSFAITAYAATLNFPYDSKRQLSINGSEQIICSSSGGGMSCYILVCTDVQDLDSTDVIMYDANDRPVWTGNGVVPHNTPTRLYCGADVYKVKVRTHNGKLGHAWAYLVE